MSVTIDEQAVSKILMNPEYSYLGAPRVRMIVDAYERMHNGKDVRFGGWAAPALRRELWRLLGSQFAEISETTAWMVVRNYRDLKRLALLRAREEEKRKAEEEAKAKKLAAAKAAKEAAAKKAAEKAAESPAAVVTPETPKPE